MIFKSAILLLLLFFFLGFNSWQSHDPAVFVTPVITPIVEPPFNPFPYNPPKIPVKRSYLTMLVGDSMTAALGLNANQLRNDLITLYPEHEFVNYNYGFAATNILTLPDRLNSETVNQEAKYPAILTQGFDLIIIESFAYNPLSQFPLDVGLKKHEEILEDSLKQIIKTKPESVVALMTPIALDKASFAAGTYDLSAEVRNQWVAEREAYIKLHRKIAQKYNIPLIDVYPKSLDANGNVDLRYVAGDHIHPSKEGVKLIAKTIAEFIFQNKIFPE